MATEPPSDSFKQAFAVLTPTNIAAKIAFDQVVEAVRIQQKTDYRKHCEQFMNIATSQSYDREIAQFRRVSENGDLSDTPTEPDSQVEEEQSWREPGMIWTGCYYLSLKNRPRPRIHWNAGRGRKGATIHLLLSTTDKSVRGFHAIFGFCRETLLVRIQKAATMSELSVNGTSIQQPYTLNRHQASIRMGPLEYRFQYTKYGESAAYYQDRPGELGDWVGLVPANIGLTPALDPISIGQWTTRNPAGQGSFGTVVTAINTRSHVVAIKTRRRDKVSAPGISAEIKTLKALTSLVDSSDNQRLLRLREVIYQYGDEQYSGSALEDVYYVFEPYTPTTLDHLIERSRSKTLDRLVILWVFREAMLGVQFLHGHGWMHGDLKPANIGVTVLFRGPTTINDLHGRCKVVLLDLDDAKYLADLPGERVRATPGKGGTIGYLAPEREQEYVSFGSDVWAMGVIGYQLRYGYHPFKHAFNPWRPGSTYEALRGQWGQEYADAIEKMKGGEFVLINLHTSPKLSGRLLLRKAVKNQPLNLAGAWSP